MFHRIAVAFLVAISSFVGGFVAQQVPNAFAQDGNNRKHIVADSITVRRIDTQWIRVERPGDVRRIDICTDGSQAGMYIQGLKDRVISIADVGDKSMNGYSCMGIYASKKSQGKGFSVAIAADGNDGGFMQYIDEKTGNVTFLTKGNE